MYNLLNEIVNEHYPLSSVYEGDNAVIDPLKLKIAGDNDENIDDYRRLMTQYIDHLHGEEIMDDNDIKEYIKDVLRLYRKIYGEPHESEKEFKKWLQM